MFPITRAAARPPQHAAPLGEAIDVVLASARHFLHAEVRQGKSLNVFLKRTTEAADVRFVLSEAGAASFAIQSSLTSLRTPPGPVVAPSSALFPAAAPWVFIAESLSPPHQLIASAKAARVATSDP